MIMTKQIKNWNLQRFTLTAVSVAILSTGMFYAPPALSVGCGSCVAETIKQGTITRSHVSERIQWLKNALSDVITRTSRDSTAAITRGQTETAKAQNENAIEIQKQADKRDAERAIGELTCDFGASANGPKGGGVSNGGGGGGSGGGSDYKPSNKVTKEGVEALATSGESGAPVVIPDDINEHKKNIAYSGCDVFAAPGSERALLCTGMDKPASGSITEFPNGDINATSLMALTANGSHQRIMSVPREGAARDARAFFLMNAYKPVPLPSFDEGALDTPMGVTYVGLYNQYEAIKSAGKFPAREYDRLTSSPATDDAETRKALSDTYKLMTTTSGGEGVSPSVTIDFVNDYLKSASDALPGSAAMSFEDLSPMALMEIEVERRIGNPDWVMEMSGKDSEAKIGEMMMMQAYQMRIGYAQLQATYQTNILLGQLIAVQADQVYRPNLESEASAMNNTYTNTKLRTSTSTPSASGG